MTSKFIKNNKGFTLVEIIIAVAVSVIIMGTVISMVLYANRAYLASTEKTSVLDGASGVTETIRETVFNSEEAELSTVITAPAMESGYTYLYCLDNVFYLDGNPIQSAKGINANVMTVEFAKDSSSTQTVTYTLSILDASGENLITPISETAFLNRCDEGITLDAESVAPYNCIRVKKSVESTT